ncbi:MAG: hypothetical protein M1829_003492 [Trizodia sp. TS-e1964]|nr:MAG: hypothetical protein M1829_003492 [Trizodia sp. TS-e1964]
MEKAICWSPHLFSQTKKFIVLNAANHTLKVFAVDNTNTATSEASGVELKYTQIVELPKLPGFRTFDWSIHDEAIVAVGQALGEITILKITEKSGAQFSYSLKYPRVCNALSFNSEGLLAAGFEKSRGDHSLMIWDVKQRLGETAEKAAKPLWSFLAGDAISSLQFFANQPSLLALGVNGGKDLGLRLIDLREGTSYIHIPTKAAHNVTVDNNNDNCFASIGPASGSNTDLAIFVWDRRSLGRSNASNLSSGHNYHPNPVLELPKLFDPNGIGTKPQPNIISLKYNPFKRGLIGYLTSSGQLRTYQTQKSIVESPIPSIYRDIPEILYIKDSQEVCHAYFHPSSPPNAFNNRTLSFDYAAGDRIISVRADAVIDHQQAPRPPPKVGILPNGGVVVGKVEIENFHHPSSNSKGEQSLKDSPPSDLSKEPVDAFYVPVKRHDGAKTAWQTMKSLRIEYMESFVDGEDGGDGEADEKNIAITATNAPKSTIKDFMISRAARNGEAEAWPTLSSREEHEMFLSLIADPDFADMQLIQDISRQRCLEGYLFDVNKNMEIWQDNPFMQDLWRWVGDAEKATTNYGMVWGNFDFAYLGVHNIWTHDFGPNYETRLIGDQTELPTSTEWGKAAADINRRAGRQKYNGVPTAFPDQRQLCLAICGWAFSAEKLEIELVKLEKTNQVESITQAAAWALFHGLPDRAIKAINKGDIQMKHIAIAIAGYKDRLLLTQEQRDSNPSWKSSSLSISSRSNDAYTRAIYSLSGSCSFKSLLSETSLPMRDRVGIALLHLSDVELDSYLDSVTQEVMSHGDIEGIVLTGITEKAIDLFQKYIARFGDIQTASLILAYVDPLYMTDMRTATWKDSYIGLMRSWKANVPRCRFLVACMKRATTRDGRTIIKAAPRQFNVVCNFCQQGLEQDEEGGNEASSFNSSSASTNVPAAGEASSVATSFNLFSPAAAAGHTCPKCGRHLPRCAYCREHMGTALSTKPEKDQSGKLVPIRRKYPVICWSCKHGMHADHSELWFSKHKVCPVHDCHCLCAKIKTGTPQSS